MLPWLELSVLFTAVTGVFELYLCARQLRRYCQEKEVPAKLKGLITQKDFDESAAYQKESMQFRMLQSGLDLVLSLVFIVCRIYPHMWNGIDNWLGPDVNEYWKSLIYVGTTYVINELTSLPFSLYSDFVIEDRHGFNKKTLRIFFMDMLKSTLVVSAIGVPVVGVIIKLVRWAGPTCYIYLWAFLVAFTILMSFVAPVVIMPLFNKFDPVADQELKGKIEELAARVNYPLTKLYQMDGSKRSSHSNAFMYGFSKNKRIVLFDTLLKHDHKEIVAILGHELGHWKFSHMIKTIVLSSAVLFAQLYLFKLIVFRPDPFISFGFQSESVIVGLFILSLILSPVNTVLSIIGTMVSRRHEFQADAYALELGYGEELGRALVNIGVDNKMPYVSDPLYAACKYSHPGLTERLQALEKKAA